MKNKKYLFVYGTLKKGNALNNLISKGKFIGNALIKGYKMFCYFEVPVIQKRNYSSTPLKVFGEVYEFSERDYYNLVPRLDYIEQNYLRITEDVYLIDEDNKKIEVEVYAYQGNTRFMKEIIDGKF